MQPLIDHLRAAVPFAVRVEIARLRRMPSWIVETPTIARRHVGATDVDRYTHVLAEHESPLRRDAVVKDESLQAGKVRNVTIASEALQHLVIEPGDVFSYHRIVGRPSRRRGFRDGLELHNGQLTRGVGGGCCQVSNLLYLLALRSGMNISSDIGTRSTCFPTTRAPCRSGVARPSSTTRPTCVSRTRYRTPCSSTCASPIAI